MKFFNTTVACLVFAASSIFTTANAGLMNIDLDRTNSGIFSDGLITYSEIVDNTYSVASDATFTLRLRGDFNRANENVDVAVEALNLGIVLNDNAADDAFDFSSKQFSFSQWKWVEDLDAGTLYKSLEGVATINRADWTNIVSDGVVNISLQSSDSTLSYSASGNISYEVPEPSTLAIFGLALLGFGARRFSK